LFIDARRDGGSSEAPPTIDFQYTPSLAFCRKIVSIVASYLHSCLRPLFSLIPNHPLVILPKSSNNFLL